MLLLGVLRRDSSSGEEGMNLLNLIDSEAKMLDLPIIEHEEGISKHCVFRTRKDVGLN